MVKKDDRKFTQPKAVVQKKGEDSYLLDDGKVWNASRLAELPESSGSVTPAEVVGGKGLASLSPIFKLVNEAIKLLLGVTSPWLCLQPRRALSRLDPSTWLLRLHSSSSPRLQHRPSSIRPHGLPRTVGSPWVGHRQASTVDLRAVRCSPALHPFGLGKLRPPSGSTSALGRTSSSSALRITTSASERCRCSSVVAAQSARWAPPPQALSPSVIPPRIHHHLLPPSTPPWAIAMAELWVNSTWPLLPLPPWMLPPSTPPWSSSSKFR
ncbi:hypothetical protein DPX16_20690 [Anabarilius grahami]|uniref:Uncharacterized protein n=1 Tax=Anabarilius grahami TaxID=495550 RepID=A0A3N0YMS5_ANAGA|nr:hypothetical protein DPX16_20690 [Anabarilius grahami]